MENWSSGTKRNVYMVTLVAMIICPAIELISGIVGLIFGISNFDQIYTELEIWNGLSRGGAFIAFIITCILVLLFHGLLVFISVFRHFSHGIFFNIFPAIVYIIKILMDFNVITGMTFSTMTSKFPILGAGWVSIPSEVGIIVLISSFVYLLMAFVSFINIRLKDMT